MNFFKNIPHKNRDAYDTTTYITFGKVENDGWYIKLELPFIKKNKRYLNKDGDVKLGLCSCRILYRWRTFTNQFINCAWNPI